MKNKKILFLSNTSWSLYNFRLGLINELIKNGYKVICCAPHDKYSEKLTKQGSVFIPVKISRKGKNLINDLLLICNLYKIYKKEHPDLILHYTIKPNIYGSIAARLAKVKCINTITGLGYVFIKKNIITIIVKLLYKISFKYPEKIFFQNNDDLKLFLKNKIINKNKSILVNGSGVDIDYFSPYFCKEHKKNDENIHFIFIGRLLWDKGIGEYVKAAKIVNQKYKDVKFYILGVIDRGNPEGVPEKIVKNWQIIEYIKYLGETSDVRPFICKTDCVVLPSFYREGIPRSLLEAMAMEKPIITTNSVGCREVIEDGKNGFLIPIKNTIKLSEAMIKMIEITENKRKEMGEYGRKKAINEFDERIVINKYMKTIEEIILY